VRVAIAEDQALLRAGLTRLFQDSGHEVSAAVRDGEELRHAVNAEQPNLAVIDVRMPPSYVDEGLQAARWIRESHPGVAVLMLSQHVETAGMVSLVSQRGFGYLLKDRVLDVEEFMSAAERVAAGGSALDPEVVATLVAADNKQGPLQALTEREREVLQLMAEGLTNAGIAGRLVLTERTVESHTRQVFIKLGLQADGDGHRRVLAVLSYLGAV
jgi:DNA-binding NarL/FixJ family response regulator